MSEEKPMSRTQLIEYVAERLGVKKAQAKELLDDLASLAAREVRRAGQFTLPGFGKIVLSQRKARTGRHPQTGEPIEIPAKTSVKFRVAKAMKDSVLSGGN